MDANLALSKPDGMFAMSHTRRQLCAGLDHSPVERSLDLSFHGHHRPSNSHVEPFGIVQSGAGRISDCRLREALRFDEPDGLVARTRTLLFGRQLRAMSSAWRFGRYLRCAL